MARIAGIIRKSWTEDAASDLETMRASIVHEPAESSGSWVHEASGLGLAWAGRQGSFPDGLPIRNAAGDVLLVFCGETFSHRGDSQSPGANGSRVDPRRAEYLLDLYDALGVELLERLNGSFCGVFVDARRHEVVLFNDRYGTRRVYYHQDGEDFYFSSEAKSLLAIEPRLRQLDARGLGEFLSCGGVLQNRTLFSGISILPAAARWTFRSNGCCDRGSYFEPQLWETQRALTPSEYVDRLGETFRRALPSYLNGPEAIGVSLTGGLDSRLILAWAKRGDVRLSCYTFGGPYAECGDVRLARRLAHACGLGHQTIAVGDEFLRRFPALAEETVYLSDGAMDVTGAVELYVNRQVREIAPVRLTGNYGSEILRSNVAFKPGGLDASVFDAELAEQLASAAVTYADERRCPRLSFIAFKQVPWYHFARAGIERSQLTMRSPYLDNELVKLAYQAPAEMAASGAYLLQLAGDGNPSLAGFATDRAIRRHPIPVLSAIAHLYRELTARAEYAYDYGMPQWLAKLDSRVAGMHLERVFLGRHKFYHFRVWYRDVLAEFVREVLLDPSALRRPYVNGKRVEAIVGQHTAGTGNYTREIHKLLTLELLQRRLLAAH